MQAQNRGQTRFLTEDDVVFKREFSMGFQAHTAGFGLSAHFVKIQDIYKKTVYEIGIMDIKHPKEFRQQSLFASGRATTRGFVYGKRNNFYTFNASVGKIKIIADKGRKSGVQISYYYGGGVSLGLLKPYFLEIIDGFSDNGEYLLKSVRYTEESANTFLNEGLIYGASGPTYGWSFVKPAPGIQAKVSVLFDWANYNEFVKAIEIGAMANAYAFLEKKYKTVDNQIVEDGLELGRIPILVGDNNSFVFANLYVRMLFGKRW
ncbi:MAG: hypothetical protein ACPG5B_14365 [Chitinophagales bacterium]